MGFIRNANDWGSAILKWMVIGLVAIGVLWFGVSIWGNVAEAINTPKPPPEIADAKYEVLLISTGQTLYADDYAEISDTAYRLDGYFEMVKNKWQYRDMSLILDKYYYGDIRIRRR